MQPSTFGLQSIIRMADAEKASALSGLVSMGLGFAKGELAKEMQKGSASDREDKAALLRVMETFTNAARGNDVELGLTFQQASLADVIKRQFAAKKPEAAVPPGGAVRGTAPAAKKGAPVKRRPARRRQ
jgi:hypothetical protein